MSRARRQRREIFRAEEKKARKIMKDFNHEHAPLKMGMLPTEGASFPPPESPTWKGNNLDALRELELKDPNAVARFELALQDGTVHHLKVPSERALEVLDIMQSLPGDIQVSSIMPKKNGHELEIILRRASWTR